MGAAPQPGFRRFKKVQKGRWPAPAGLEVMAACGGGLCRKVVFADAQGAKVKRFLRLTGLWPRRFLGLPAAFVR